MMTNRRQLLKAGIAGSFALGVDTIAPSCWTSVACSSETATNNNILVVIQLSGGNDGLNTVIPIEFADEYKKQRPTLAVASSDQVKIDKNIHLHPELRILESLFENGQMSIVQGVGYENPNRSHFESMDIWHTCQRKGNSRQQGWLGKLLDGQSVTDGIPAIHFGEEQQPLALQARDVRVPSVKSLDEFRLQARQQDSSDFEKLIQQLSEATREEATESNDLLSFVRASTSSAIVASQQVNEARTSYKPATKYPESALAQRLSVVAQLIDAELPTQIYYVTLDGFDTHAEQAATHEVLLRTWGQALSAFVNDLNAHGHGSRVSVMTFSEFGRRVSENASRGTDHGAAAPMFFAGGGLKQSIIGSQPSLTDLQNGDLKHSVDFRSVYGTVLRDWLGTNSQSAESIVGEGHLQELKIYAS